MKERTLPALFKLLSNPDGANVNSYVSAPSLLSPIGYTFGSTGTLFKFDMIGSDEITLTPGAYVIEISYVIGGSPSAQAPGVAMSLHPDQVSGGGPYAGGRAYLNNTGMDNRNDFRFAVTGVIPEPGTLMLAGAGLLLLAARRRA